ncbi:MAG: rhomboid family intramembrane serine protease [Micavibrio sp.]|nr:rhomboid family intramembrane serine protease [Micavibrio sp.]
MFFPISDENEHGHHHYHQDAVHFGVMFICLAVFGIQFYFRHDPAALGAFQQRWFFDAAQFFSSGLAQMPPAQRVHDLITTLADVKNMALPKLLANIFRNDGWWYLLPNLFVLWMLGDNVSYAQGSWRYVIFFLLAGMLCQLTALLFATDTAYLSSVGASGAVMAVAAAYMVYFPKARINILYYLPPQWIGVTSLSARIVIALYALVQAGVAWHYYGTGLGVLAHVSGFIWGIILCYPLRNWKQPLEQPVARAPYRTTVSEFIKDYDHWGHGH